MMPPGPAPVTGRHVTLVKDATAAYTEETMYAAHELNGPTVAHAILTTSELVAVLPRAAALQASST